GAHAHAAAPDDDHALAQLYAGRVEDRAKPGAHAAGEERDLLERHVLPHRYDRSLRHDDALGERRLREPVVDRCAAEAQARRAAGKRAAEDRRAPRRAEPRASLDARGAAAAAADGRQHDVIADGDARDIWSDGFDDA